MCCIHTHLILTSPGEQRQVQVDISSPSHHLVSSLCVSDCPALSCCGCYHCSYLEVPESFRSTLPKRDIPSGSSEHPWLLCSVSSNCSAFCVLLSGKIKFVEFRSFWVWIDFFLASKAREGREIPERERTLLRQVSDLPPF